MINNEIYLAPMAGVTNSSFRTLCKKMKCGVVCCEMVSDSGIVHMNKKTLNMCKLDNKQRPISLQIFGSDVKTFTQAAKFVEENSCPDFIDINMGCPARKVAYGKEAGSALLKKPDLVYEIVKNVVDCVKTPVTVKIRSG
jgi:tRNA-dihydrouridine synthase